MKKILGLDLGTSSVGWALIETKDDNTPIRIIDMGVRIVPLADGESDKFIAGQNITTNSSRTQKRTLRKGFDRYQARRAALSDKLQELGMMPDDKLMHLNSMELWNLRANAAQQRITLPELGRVLYHLNQKRGYRHAKEDCSESKKRNYVEIINNRYGELIKEGKTIGQHFAAKMAENTIFVDGKAFYNYRIKDQIYPRKAYMEEYDAIMKCQQQFYPNLLTNDAISYLRDHIIYYQRKLKTCKHLVSVCEFEKRCFYDKDGNIIRNLQGEIVYDGPRVAPRTSPLFQLCKCWEAVNNIKFHNRRNDELFISVEQRKQMVEFMETHELLKLQDVYRILGITKKDGWYAGDLIGRGIKGNTTRIAFETALQGYPNREDFLQFKLKTVDTKLVDDETGEVIQRISCDYTSQPLYRLWHLLYSIDNRDELAAALEKQFGIKDPDTVDRLFAIDLVTPGYGNKSSKAICRILPYLQQGFVFSDACEYAGFRHSDSLTTEERMARSLKKVLPAIKKNELRQPVVEKILNQMINIYNALTDEKMYGPVDEVRIELARELKQSKEERESSNRCNKAQQRKNLSFAKLIEEFGIRPSRNSILKYRLWEESEHKCFYCNQPINVVNFLKGTDAEREHIIPKSLLFDNGFSNQVCSCRKCNQEKGGRTAMDFMRTKPNTDEYIERVETLMTEKKISAAKHDRLLSSYEDYLSRKKNGKETASDKHLWEEFIERQLRLSQYISRKAQDILSQGCRNVWSTSGSVTDFVRHLWGFDTVLHDLNLPDARKSGHTEMVEYSHAGQTHIEERITDWNKRLDHRHHAVDALAIACTTQGMIQRLNSLSASRNLLLNEVESDKETWHDDYSLLQQWVRERQPFSQEEVTEAVSRILVSVKAGKRATTPGKRKTFGGGKPKVMQTGILVPRGALHEESVYGGIQQYKKEKEGSTSLQRKIVIKYKVGVGIGCVFGGKETLTVENNKKTGKLELKDGIQDTLSYIVDKHIREVIKERINSAFPTGTTYRTSAENAYQEGKTYDAKEEIKMIWETMRNVDENPIYFDEKKTITIRSVRCFTGLNAVQPLHYENGKPKAYVITKNNHHMALYRDEHGNFQESIVTLWDAVERKTHGLPVIIDRPSEVWSDILHRTAELPQALLNKLPNDHWTFELSMQRNQMFILGMSDDEYCDALESKDYKAIGKHLYRVQSISTCDYIFRLHTDTSKDVTESARKEEKFLRIKSVKAFLALHPRAIKISLLGKLV